MAGPKKTPTTSATTARMSAWVVGAVLTTALTMFAGVGLAAVLGQSGTAENWDRWSNVGQTFGALSSVIAGLAVAAVLITARVQVQEMRRSSTADLSMLHLEIMKLSIEDPSLAAVWPDFQPGLSEERNRQFLYANIIYQFNWTALKLDKADDEQVINNMRYLFTSSLMRQYWSAAARGRRSLPPGSQEYRFSQMVDQLCHEYDTAVETFRRDQTRPGRRPGDRSPNTTEPVTSV